MANKTINTRIQNKRGTSSDWAQATTFKPLEGEVIVYTDINKIKVGDGNTLVSDLSFVEPKGGLAMFGSCATVPATAAKVITVYDAKWELQVGAIIGVKFAYTNTASNVTLNVNGTGAKSIWYNGSAYTSNGSTVCGAANRLNYYMYDGTYWCWLNCGTINDSNTYTSAYCATAAATAAKTASCTNYALLNKSYTQITMVYTNTSASALTLNINSKGAKPIYINGAASSSSNYTLPAGTYFIYYDGTNYYFRTDGKLTIDGGTALSSHQSIKSLSTTSTTALTTSSSEAIAGSGTISLHKIAKTGTYSDLIGKPTIPTITLNGSSTTSPSFYAPTSAGTNGYVLTSSGSGAPTWKAASSASIATTTVSGISKLVTGEIAINRAYANGEAAAAAHTHAGYLKLNNESEQIINSDVRFSDATPGGVATRLYINAMALVTKPLYFENQVVSNAYATLSYANADQNSEDPNTEILLPTVSCTLAKKTYEHNIQLSCKETYSGTTYALYVYLTKYHTKATALTFTEIIGMLSTSIMETATGYGKANVEDVNVFPMVNTIGVRKSGSQLIVEVYGKEPSTTNFNSFWIYYSSANVSITDIVREVN